MHEQVMVLGTLWRLDLARDELIAEARAMAAKVNGGKAAVAESEALIASLSERIDTLKLGERVHARRAEQYIKRRDRTRQAIDEGRIADFLVAEKQVSDCAAIVDTEEEAILELMEQQEELDGQRTRTQTGLELRRVQLETARTMERERRPTLEAELDVLTVKRDEARTDVRREILGIYDQRRGKGKRITAPLANKGCGGCRVKLAALRYSDVKRGVDIFMCDNCGCFLTPAETEEGDDATEEVQAG